MLRVNLIGMQLMLLFVTQLDLQLHKHLWSGFVYMLNPLQVRMGYAAGYKKDVDLEMLDPTGVAVEKWILQGCFLTNV
jgi:hypothetical protein